MFLTKLSMESTLSRKSSVSNPADKLPSVSIIHWIGSFASGKQVFFNNTAFGQTVNRSFIFHQQGKSTEIKSEHL